MRALLCRHRPASVRVGILVPYELIFKVVEKRYHAPGITPRYHAPVSRPRYHAPGITTPRRRGALAASTTCLSLRISSEAN